MTDSSNVPEGVVTLDNEAAARLHMHIGELTEAVEKRLPHFRNLLSIIHKILREDPSVVTLMSSEEVANLVSGMELDKGVRIAEAMPKAKSAKKTADDF